MDVSQRLSEIESGYQILQSRAAQAYEQGKGRLVTNYRNALNARKKQAMRKGLLNEGLKWDAEIALVNTGKIPASPDEVDSDPDIGSLRETWRKELAELERQRAQAEYDAALRRDEVMESLQVDLTKARRLDDATVVFDKRKKWQEMMPEEPEGPPRKAETSSTTELEPLIPATEIAGRLLVHGQLRGKPLKVPASIEKYTFNWVKIVGGKEGYLAASKEAGTFFVDHKSAKRIGDYVADLTYGSSWDGTALTEDGNLKIRFKGDSKGTIRGVRQYGATSFGGCPTLVYLKDSGELKLKTENVRMAWNFNAWADQKNFKDVALSDWKGIAAGIAAVTTDGELYIFNNEGIYTIPEEIRTGVKSIESGNYVSFSVFKDDGKIYLFWRPSKREFPLDVFFGIWKEVPSTAFRGGSTTELSTSHR